MSFQDHSCAHMPLLFLPVFQVQLSFIFFFISRCFSHFPFNWYSQFRSCPGSVNAASSACIVVCSCHIKGSCFFNIHHTCPTSKLAGAVCTPHSPPRMHQLGLDTSGPHQGKPWALHVAAIPTTFAAPGTHVSTPHTLVLCSLHAALHGHDYPFTSHWTVRLQTVLLCTALSWPPGVRAESSCQRREGEPEAPTAVAWAIGVVSSGRVRVLGGRKLIPHAPHVACGLLVGQP